MFYLIIKIVKIIIIYILNLKQGEISAKAENHRNLNYIKITLKLLIKNRGRNQQSKRDTAPHPPPS